MSDRSGRYLIRGVATGEHRLRLARSQPYLDDAADLRLLPAPLPAAVPEANASGE